jgi:superfamily II DNA/RNA helicase
MQYKERDKELLERLGFGEWNDMQVAAYDTIIKEAEVLLLAPTGSGKTVGFLRPIADILKKDVRGVQCLILVPSRELALQIELVWKQMNTGFKVNSSYGGHSIESEMQSLGTPPAVLVGTPGRITDHLTRGTFSTDTIRVLVLDEFDKSLELGFEEEMSIIAGHLTRLERKVLVSATNAVEIPAFVELTATVTLDFSDYHGEEVLLDLKLVLSKERDKIDALFNLLCFLGNESTIIFCNHREATERVNQLLLERGIGNAVFHGGLEQMEREQTLVRFRNGSVRFLVATDLAARGLDIPEVNHVVHYHLPSSLAEFTHRNGRTARMKSKGTAYIIQYEGEPLPTYIENQPNILDVPQDCELPSEPEWATLFISGGRKDKVNKGDIVGFFSKVGKLAKDELGMIEVKDHVSFAAVRKTKVKELLKQVADEKLKGKKYKIAVAR